MFDRFVAAEWIDNIKEIKSSQQEGVMKIRPIWKKGSASEADGMLKLVAFSKLFKELSKGGPISMNELGLIVSYGLGTAIQAGGQEI